MGDTQGLCGTVRGRGGMADVDRVLGLLADRARALVAARGVAILLCDGERLRAAAVSGDADAAAADAHGPWAHAPRRDGRGGLLVPLAFDGRPLGVLSAVARDAAAGFSPDDERRLEGFGASAAAAVATAQSAAGESLRRSIEASERERRRWARELHDETLQELAGLKVLLARARRSERVATLHRALDEAIEQIDTEIAGLRRLIADLRPATLDEFGLRPALEALADRVAATSGLEIELEVDPAFASRGALLDPATENTLYRLVQEALRNVAKHAAATRVEIALLVRDGRAEAHVVDDGRGFAPDRPTDGLGLIGMRERVTLVDGTLAIDSRPGAGTRVRASVPIRQPDGTDAPIAVAG